MPSVYWWRRSLIVSSHRGNFLVLNYTSWIGGGHCVHNGMLSTFQCRKNALNWLTPSIVQSTSNRIMHITCEVHSLTLQSSEAIIVPHRIIWSWYTRRWWVGCYISYCDEGTGRGRSLPRSLIAVPNWQPAHQRPVYQQSYCGIMVCCPMCIQLAKSTM